MERESELLGNKWGLVLCLRIGEGTRAESSKILVQVKWFLLTQQNLHFFSHLKPVLGLLPTLQSRFRGCRGHSETGDEGNPIAWAALILCTQQLNWNPLLLLYLAVTCYTWCRDAAVLPAFSGAPPCASSWISLLDTLFCIGSNQQCRNHWSKSHLLQRWRKFMGGLMAGCLFAAWTSIP